MQNNMDYVCSSMDATTCIDFHGHTVAYREIPGNSGKIAGGQCKWKHVYTTQQQRKKGGGSYQAAMNSPGILAFQIFLQNENKTNKLRSKPESRISQWSIAAFLQTVYRWGIVLYVNLHSMQNGTNPFLHTYYFSSKIRKLSFWRDVHYVKNG